MKLLPSFRILELLPFILVFSTVFAIDSTVQQGVIYGKHFWFYASMGAVAVVSLFLAAPTS